MKSLEIESPLVSVNWLQTNIEADNLVILDATVIKVSDSEIDTNKEKIPKSIYFDIKNRFSDISSEFPNTLPSKEQFEIEAQRLGINNNSAIVIYDKYGIYSSARAWWLFNYFGHKNVAVLDGGLPQWIAEGFETVNNYQERFKKDDFSAKENLDLMTDFNGILKFLTAENSQIIDARSAKRFNCEIPEPRKGLRSGTIPNSINLPFTELLNENIVKSKTELRSIFNSILNNHKTHLVFSCGSGITACILALGATLAGYKNITLYDGSWTEYGTLID